MPFHIIKFYIMVKCDRILKCTIYISIKQFQKNTEHANFSNSVVDVFTQLTQCFDVLQKLECQDPEIWKRYMKRFAKTVAKVLTEYSNVLQSDFHNHVKDESKVHFFYQKCTMQHRIRNLRSEISEFLKSFSITFAIFH